MKPLNQTKQTYRQFGLTLAVFISLVFGLFIPWLKDSPMTTWPWIVSAVLSGWAAILPGTLGILYRPWMAIGHRLGLINTKLILGLMFYLVFTPVALFLRLMGKDAMHRTLNDKSTASYWKESPKRPDDHMEKIY